ncbi:tryptophan 7-halogenase [Halioglobus maricola]|uniref:Tryptophan 7-halogenase n=1 Tax=Halioglobus maricola TaxID=2601894 RepID=A0A5P9NNE1_9GAMM|nr:tryptophan halogenase family protein [Halioglobus maricola]QFU77340.1 tryptophan 7-halogenase [Halioglobus maricola]
MQQGPIEQLVIVGGGTAGWMAAANLAEHFKHSGLSITLVESSQIGTIGVGEATIPSIRRFYGALGLKDEDVLRRTNGTCKLAIRFDGWSKPGDAFYHPFGLYGQDVRQVGFHHYWLKMHRAGKAGPISDYSLGVALADGGKFTRPSPRPPSPLSVFDWALHFDASLFAKVMKESALANGVKAIDAKIESVELNAETGFIDSLALDTGAKLEGELFIDCSGFRGLLIEGALETGYESWSEWLHCDRAVAMQSELDDTQQLVPYTRSIAHKAGWQWKIPLTNRQGNGYVFSSAHISDDEALATLRDNVKGSQRTEPNFIPFVPGRRRRAWNRNCIAVGLSSGFLEPLESTSIALIETAIDKIKLLFPDKSFRPGVIDEFNEMTALEYERVRDFIILHYKLNGRHGEPFWDQCREMEVPDTLARKMQLFKERGHLVKYRWEIFQNASWLAMYNGLNYLPDGYDPAVDHFDIAYLEKAFFEMKKSLDEGVAATPRHEDFLQEIGR